LTSTIGVLNLGFFIISDGQISWLRLGMVKLTAGFTLGEFCSDGLVDELEWLLID
jgi:hypothetical protein